SSSAKVFLTLGNPACRARFSGDRLSGKRAMQVLGSTRLQENGSTRRCPENGRCMYLALPVCRKTGRRAVVRKAGDACTWLCPLAGKRVDAIVERESIFDVRQSSLSRSIQRRPFVRKA